MNKFELRLLKNEFKDVKILNAECLYNNNAGYELIVIYKHKDTLFCTSSSSNDKTHCNENKMSYSRLLNLFRAVLSNEIITLNNLLFAPNFDPANIFNTAYEINRVFHHFANALRKSNVYKSECEYWSIQVFEKIVKMLEEGHSPLDCYKNIFSIYEEPYEELFKIDFNKLDFKLKEVA